MVEVSAVVSVQRCCLTPSHPHPYCSGWRRRPRTHQHRRAALPPPALLLWPTVSTVTPRQDRNPNPNLIGSSLESRRSWRKKEGRICLKKKKLGEESLQITQVSSMAVASLPPRPPHRRAVLSPTALIIWPAVSTGPRQARNPNPNLVKSSPESRRSRRKRKEEGSM